MQTAQAKISYLMEEIHAQWHRFELGHTVLTPAVIQVFKKKWLGECHQVETLILAARLSPQSMHITPQLDRMLEELKEHILGYINLLQVRYDATGAAPVADSETEQERLRRERKERMARYQRGDKT